jgi:2',3'-cyclic-nucleotide 2'-phosphodiesterase (5'-nucleotidase family)
MKLKTTSRVMAILITIALLFSLVSITAAAPAAAPSAPVTFTILHTNDFHGQLEASNVDPTKASNPGSARVAAVVNKIRTEKGATNVLLVDAGDQMQGSLLSNLGDGTATGKGSPTIGTYNAMGYNVATFGNHEFDWGQVNLAARTTQATYPYVTANIVKNDTGNCATAGWTKPDFADNPFEVLMVGSPTPVKVAFIGVTTTETPTITVSTATAGLCFKDPADSIIHYYDAMKAAGADVIVVLSHLGFSDGGYGYGIPVYGDGALAAKLNTAGKPANLIIGGHSHTNTMPPLTLVGSTTIAQAYYNGRNVGQADVTVSTSGAVSVSWQPIAWKIPPTTTPPSTTPFGWKLYSTSSAYTDFLDATKDATIDALVTSYATNPSYVAIVNQPIGYSAVDLNRTTSSAAGSGNVDNMMGTFIDDAIYNYLNADAEPSNDIDIFFNNAGGIRTEWCWSGSAWVNTNCFAPTTHEPALLTYGNMFTVLPFGNATVVGKMTGAQILEVINYGPNVAGVIQPAGLKYSYFKYKDALPGPQPYAWGAFDVCVINKATHNCDPLDLKKTYNVGTNEFLAPAGGDGYSAFKYMTNITYWGDMLNAVNAYVSTNYGTEATAYMGPNGDGTLDGRITRDGTDAGGSIVPLTVLHHNDSHGNVAKASYVGYTQLATLIKQERLHNPTHTLLLNGGDSIQGDAMMYYFKTAFSGFASDGTPLAADLQINPLIKAFNSMGYDAMTLGNHEFNFGSTIFKGELGQATFPLLQANSSDDGSYGFAAVGVQPYVTKALGAEGIKVSILGIGNHRVPNYELPSNIPGLTFSNPIAKAQELSTLLRPTSDVVIALTHIGFTENPSSVEVDANVDTNLAATVTGIDAIIGSHSHTNPASGFGLYKYLPSIISNPDGKPVIINQAYRYNNTLGEVVMGLRAKAGGYEVVSETGRYLSVAMTTAEDPDTKAIIDPYVAALTSYNNTAIGQTTAPIDALQAFTQETNGANLQADAAVYELSVKHSIPVDFHLSGAMTNSKIASTATTAAPYTLKISDMFTAMPYENSLLVISMNGPQLKTVLERAYRNYYYYKYVPGYGGYSYYTTCMLDTNFGNQIKYNDLYPALPNGNNVVSLNIGGVDVDFANAAKYYNVSTVNYLAAGSCNFNDGGVTLWPLNQIVQDTQYYVRDAVIDYTTFKGVVSPAIEGRLNFITDTTGPVIMIVAPTATTYLHPDSLTLDFSAADDLAGVKTTTASLDGVPVTNGQVIDLYTLALGNHTLAVNAVDKAGNASTQSVEFSITATVDSLKTAVDRFYQDGSIKNKGVYKQLMHELMDASSTDPEETSEALRDFIHEVKHNGRQITKQAADLLIADANWVIIHLPDISAPTIKIYSPQVESYLRYQTLKLNFSASDKITGVKEVTATLDGVSVTNGQKLNLYTMALGNHTLTVNAVDYAGNVSTKSVTFKVVVKIHHH